MKKSAIAFAALVALTGSAFAENPNVGISKDKAPISLDQTTTQSIRDTSTDASNPRLGYEGSPWFISNFK